VAWLKKPLKRKTEKARRSREETAVKQSVRKQVVARDGYCRLQQATDLFGLCRGPSTWQHLLRRSATMGQAPERRHNTATSMMLCREHHRQIDEYEIAFEYLTEAGADGPMKFELDGQEFRETSVPSPVVEGA
jgi:hypothetical protein